MLRVFCLPLLLCSPEPCRPFQEAATTRESGTQNIESEERNETLLRIARQAGSRVRWIRDPYARYDMRQRRSGRKQPYVPPVDREKLLQKALERARSEKRLVLLYAFRIEGRHMYRAPLVDDYMNLALFSDPELVELINRKFIPLRLYLDKELGERFGIKNSDQKDKRFLESVEPALLFLTPDGKLRHVVQRIRTFSVPWMRYVLETMLRRHPKLDAASELTLAVRSGMKGEDPAGQVYLAKQLLLDGEEEKALAMLEKIGLESNRAERLRELAKHEKARPRTRERAVLRAWLRKLSALRRELRGSVRVVPEAWLARAGALRLLRRPDEALDAVRAAREAGADDPDFVDRASLEEARIHERLGDWSGVDAALEGARPGAEREYRLGVSRFLRWETEAADAHFSRAVALAEAPYSWKAAAMLARSDDTTRISPLAHGFEPLEAGPSKVYRGLPRTSEAIRDRSPAAAKPEVVRHAVSYLLEQQRPDGSWADARYAYWPTPEILPNVRVAITALASTALLAWRDVEPDRIDVALKQAEPYLRDDGRITFGTEEEVYSQAYRILYFVRKAETLHGDTRQTLFANLDSLMKQARKIQDPSSGFFKHEYHNAFCTGAMMWSLYLAKSLGVQVDEDMIALGVKALASARRDDGSFSYSGSSAKRKGGSITSNLKNSSARMPLCETVLHAFGSSDSKKVAKAFETWLEYLDRIERVRKCDFHSDGQLGGFFFWHSVFHASEAKAHLGGKLRKKVETTLLDMVTRIQEIDGSFVDSHELGKSYGTAMALLVLANLPD
ncbi:MAG: hypothetical protein ACE5F1_09140 [Planctomycetota bacterium]